MMMVGAVCRRGRGTFAPLHYAVHHDNAALVDALLRRKEVNVNQRDLFGRTALHMVNPARRDDSVPRLLIAHGADLTVRDMIEQWTPLHQACVNADTRLARLLLEAENHLRPTAADSTTDTSLRSPLFLASQVYRNNVLRMIMEHPKYRDDMEVQNCFITPLEIAVLRSLLLCALLCYLSDAASHLTIFWGCFACVEANGAVGVLCNAGGAKRGPPSVEGVCRRILGASSEKLTSCTNGQLHHMWECSTCAHAQVCTFCALRCHMGHHLHWSRLDRDPCGCHEKHVHKQ
jgi:hypothetical protein